MSLFNFANLSDSLQAFSDANYPKSIWSSDHPINAEHRYFFFPPAEQGLLGAKPFCKSLCPQHFQGDSIAAFPLAALRGYFAWISGTSHRTNTACQESITEYPFLNGKRFCSVNLSFHMWVLNPSWALLWKPMELEKLLKVTIPSDL